MVTDFFVDGSTPLVFGRRRYFQAELDHDEGALTLRAIGGRGQRNSYITRDGELGPIAATSFSRQDWARLFSDLGEWCPFTPV